MRQVDRLPYAWVSLNRWHPYWCMASRKNPSKLTAAARTVRAMNVITMLEIS